MPSVHIPTTIAHNLGTFKSALTSVLGRRYNNFPEELRIIYVTNVMGSSQSAIVNQSELPRGNGAASSKHNHKKRSRSECNTADSNSSSTTQTENVVTCENYILVVNKLGLQTLSDSINHNDVPPLDKSSDDAYHESWESLLQNGGNVARDVTSDLTNTQFNLHGQIATLSKGVGDDAKERKAKKDGIIFGMKCVELAVNFGLVAYIFKFTRDEDGNMLNEEYRGTLTHTNIRMYAERKCGR